jgi:hypothetical protein
MAQALPERDGIAAGAGLVAVKDERMALHHEGQRTAPAHAPALRARGTEDLAREKLPQKSGRLPRNAAVDFGDVEHDTPRGDARSSGSSLVLKEGVLFQECREMPRSTPKPTAAPRRKPTHGGARAGSGRKAGDTVPVTVRLHPAVVEYLGEHYGRSRRIEAMLLQVIKRELSHASREVQPLHGELQKLIEAYRRRW